MSRKILGLAIGGLLFMGAGCASGQQVLENSESVLKGEIRASMTAQETLPAVLKLHDLAPHGQQGTWVVTKVVKSPNKLFTLVVFGDVWDDTLKPANAVTRGFYVLSGADPATLRSGGENNYEHNEKNWFLLKGPYEHVSLGKVDWLDNEKISYEQWTGDEGGSSTTKGIFTVVNE